MTQILELSDEEFKITMINKKGGSRNMQEQMSNVGRMMEILRKNQKEMSGIKNTVIEMMNAFELISRLAMAEERISKLMICQQKLPN